MVPNWFLDHSQPFLYDHFLIRSHAKVFLYWLQVSLQPDCKNLGSGVPILMAADKPCPHLQPSLPWGESVASRLWWFIAGEAEETGVALTEYPESLSEAILINVFDVDFMEMCEEIDKLWLVWWLWLPVVEWFQIAKTRQK